MRPVFLIALTPLLLWGGVCAAQAAIPSTPAESSPAPVLSADDAWARDVLVGFGVVLGLAVVIGPIYRAVVPEELPPTHSHDEPPGASGRHGPGGESVTRAGERGWGSGAGKR